MINDNGDDGDDDDGDDGDDDDDDDDGLAMIFDFHGKCQVDKMFHLDKEKTKTSGNRRKVYFCGYLTLPFQTPFFLRGLCGAADQLGPINYCMASNLSCKTNNKKQKDVEIKWKQQYDVEKNPGPRSEAQR